MKDNLRNVRIELLASNHNKSKFSCGVEVMDRYLHHHASQDIKRKVAATFVLVAIEEPDLIMGYYTLSSNAIDPGELELSVRKKLPPYSLIPATLLGRLARDLKHKGLGVGEVLLADALNRSLQHSKEIVSFAVVVDAIDMKAHNWYAINFGFIPLKTTTSRLYLPMKTIQQLVPTKRRE